MAEHLDRFARIKSLLQNTQRIDSHTISLVVAECDMACAVNHSAAHEPSGACGYLSPEALGALRQDGTRANLYPSKSRDTDVAVYTRPDAASDVVPLDALHAVERQRDHWRDHARTMSLHHGGESWYWQGDGTDHLESLTNDRPVVIRAGQMRELLKRPAPTVPEGVLVPMTKAQVDEVCKLALVSTPRSVESWIEMGIRFAEEHHAALLAAQAK